MNWKAEVCRVSFARAASFLIVLVCIALSPSTASAQVGSQVVAITYPRNGSTVSGTITVTAGVSSGAAVQGVQFQLDGANLGPERTYPYETPWNTTTATNGSHTLRAVARDAVGLKHTSDPVVVTVSNDTIPPTVSITAPTSGATVSGVITVSANASDNVGVVGVQFKLDGAALGAEVTTAPYSVQWNTRMSPNGSHTITAVARDAAANIGTASPVTVTVSNAPDTIPPTVSITSPTSGATVSGIIAVTATASDNVGVVGVQFQLDSAPLGAEVTTAPYSVNWDTRSSVAGSHTLSAVARDAAGNKGTASPVTVTVSNSAPSDRGDVFVGMTDGRVFWYGPDGTYKRTLSGVSDGEASGLAFDSARNLYVPHWYSKIPLQPGNTVARFDTNGNLLGVFGSGYNCNPSSFAFDAAGNVYVGQADCSGNIFKFDAAGNFLRAFAALTGRRGADHIDLASDGCTMFYSNWTKDVMRFNVCTNTQMLPFNKLPMPGEQAFHLRILPDGGVLVADTEVIVRLDASGNQIQTYVVPGPNYWSGVDLVGDGSFWATNSASADVYKFNLSTGAVLARFNTGTGSWTAVGVAIKP
jgi:ribosomal protein L35AE/L33A